MVLPPLLFGVDADADAEVEGEVEVGQVVFFGCAARPQEENEGSMDMVAGHVDGNEIVGPGPVEEHGQQHIAQVLNIA